LDSPVIIHWRSVLKRWIPRLLYIGVVY